jgi:hypothetical protein
VRTVMNIPCKNTFIEFDQKQMFQDLQEIEEEMNGEEMECQLLYLFLSYIMDRAKMLKRTKKSSKSNVLLSLLNNAQTSEMTNKVLISVIQETVGNASEENEKRLISCIPQFHQYIPSLQIVRKSIIRNVKMLTKVSVNAMMQLGNVLMKKENCMLTDLYLLKAAFQTLFQHFAVK